SFRRSSRLRCRPAPAEWVAEWTSDRQPDQRANKQCRGSGASPGLFPFQRAAEVELYSGPKMLTTTNERCAYVRRHLLDRGRPGHGAVRLQHRRYRDVGARYADRKAAYSAGAITRPRAFSTLLTKSAIAAVATTKPSAMAAVAPSTRSKPPRAYRMAITDTAAPETMKVRK